MVVRGSEKAGCGRGGYLLAKDPTGKLSFASDGGVVCEEEHIITNQISLDDLGL